MIDDEKRFFFRRIETLEERVREWESDASDYAFHKAEIAQHRLDECKYIATMLGAFSE